VGVIRVGRDTIQILPKIDYDPVGDAEAQPGTIPHEIAIHSATKNLLHMLSYTQDLQIREQDATPLLTQRSDWFEILTRLFAVELHRQMKQGLQRSYVVIEDTLRVMRGRWQLDRQLTQRPHARHLFDVAYDEFSTDTPLNQIFQFVSECLLRRSTDLSTCRLLRDIDKWLVDVEHQNKIVQAHLDAVHFTRLNARFQPAFSLARLFVENQAFQLTAGARDTLAFVFDMNRLFEQFVFKFIERHRRYILEAEWGNVRLREQAKGQSVFLAERLPDRRRVFRLAPDILFTRPSGTTLLILDTKYKQLDATRRQLAVSEADMYQLLAYAVAFECPSSLLLYPHRTGAPALPIVFETPSHPHRLVVATLDLHQPLDRPEGMVRQLRKVMKEVFPHGPSTQV
jgi:5-methylcytosine-specific restriction enzyme subunit McrC